MFLQPTVTRELLELAGHAQIDAVACIYLHPFYEANVGILFLRCGLRVPLPRAEYCLDLELPFGVRCAPASEMIRHAGQGSQAASRHVGIG